MSNSFFCHLKYQQYKVVEKENSKLKKEQKENAAEKENFDPNLKNKEIVITK